MTADNSACFSIDRKHLIPCDVCGTPFKPRQKNSKHCSQLCHGRRKRYVTITCIVCGETKTRGRHGSKDSNLCCSRQCGFVWQTFIRKETFALKKIKINVDKVIKAALSRKIAPEIKAIKTIASNNKSPKLCKACGDIVYTKFVSLHPNCRKAYEQQQRKDYRKIYKKSDTYKISRRADKARRRAKQRGATVAHAINPLVILERDKWKCYLCGTKTPRELRGTYKDNAPEVDHIIPLSKGGLHVESNLKCACRKCNIFKSDQIYQLI